MYQDSYFFVMLKAGSGPAEHYGSVIITFRSSQTRGGLLTPAVRLQSSLIRR
jgi:hypothetical protein